MKFALMNDTLYLTLMGKLCGVFCELYKGKEWPQYTVKPVCNDHLYNKIITCDLFSNVF